MRIEEALAGVSRLFLDTAPVIYFVERNPEFVDRVDPIFARLESEITTVTVFGQLNQTQIGPYITRQTPVYRVIPGTREAAIATLTSEHTLWTWVFRAGGFLMMWFGLMLMGSPLSAFLDVIPWLGDVAEGITFVSSLITAFVLSSVTILAAMLLFHPVALLLAIGTTIAALLVLRRWRPRSV